MSARFTADEVLRWAIRICNHRAPQVLRTHPLLAKAKLDTGLSHIGSAGTCQGQLAGRPVSIVRYYCQTKERQDSCQSESVLPATQSTLTQTFHDRLLECGSPSDVLDLSPQYSPTAKRLANSLTRMWSITKTMTDEQRRYELKLMFEHAGFEELLQRTMLEARYMKSQDLAFSLLALVKLGTAQNSRMVQTLLRVAQERLNEFDEKALSVMASCLESMESSPNVDALKQGMRLIIDQRLPGIRNVFILQTLMRSAGRDASPELKKKLERKALSMSDQFSLPNAQYMIATLAKMGFTSKPLMKICSKTITENVYGIPFNRVLRLLVAYKELSYRDKVLFTAISDNMASTIEMWDNKQVLIILSFFEDVGFSPTSLMDMFLPRVIQDPDALKLKDLFCILKCYSSLNHDLQDHRQQFLDSITGMLESYLPKMTASEVLKAVSCLCVFSHYPPLLLEQLLQRRTLEELGALGEKPPKRMLWMLRMVDTCLRMEQPHPHLPGIPTPALGLPDPEEHPLNPTLSQTLRSMLADTETLQEGVLLENGYFIDGVITRPLQVIERTAQSESESGPPEPARFAVICSSQSFFCYGTSRPRGRLAVELRHLRTLGYTPVLVIDYELQNLPEEERADFLRARVFPEHQTQNIEPGPDPGV